eukprot:1873-Heterococcus_DN1.PRE.2
MAAIAHMKHRQKASNALCRVMLDIRGSLMMTAGVPTNVQSKGARTHAPYYIYSISSSWHRQIELLPSKASSNSNHDQ